MNQSLPSLRVVTAGIRFCTPTSNIFPTGTSIKFDVNIASYSVFSLRNTFADTRCVFPVSVEVAGLVLLGRESVPREDPGIDVQQDLELTA